MAGFFMAEKAWNPLATLLNFVGEDKLRLNSSW